VSTFANDGVYVPPRIVAGTVPPTDGLQTVSFHPGASHRVISSFTAAQMRSMMEKVVTSPGATGRRATLEGYSSAGKTGTGQKADPATGVYSKTKYVGSFAGLAPVNNPQIVVVVILDSAVGPHQGGQVAAPVFRRIAQQVLEYLHVLHDLPLAQKHQLLLAQAKMKDKDKDLEEGTPDHPGEPLETAEVTGDSPVKTSVARVPTPANAGAITSPVVQAAMRQPAANGPQPMSTSSATEEKSSDIPATAQEKLPLTGTVVLDVEQGGIE